VAAVIRESIHPNTAIIRNHRPVWPGFLPVPGGRLQDGELVTVWVAKDMPAPARLGHGLAGESFGSQREDTLDFADEVNGVRIQLRASAKSFSSS
jgi:hypothetical protein